MNLNILLFYTCKRVLNILELPGIEPLLDSLRSALSLITLLYNATDIQKNVHDS